VSDDGEFVRSFECFGSTCIVSVIDDDGHDSAREAVEQAQTALLAWHGQFSRFLLGSELSRLNANDAWTVSVSPLMVRLLQAVAQAGTISNGLVDATLIDAIERAGYTQTLGESIPLEAALALAPARKPARARRDPLWAGLQVDWRNASVTRPPGAKIDSGGLAKGLFADVLAERLVRHAGFAIVCAGDLAIGGGRKIPRPVNVESPFDGRILHTFELSEGGVATSGIGRRSWLDGHGRPAHHLLDPLTGTPAFTGVVQVTALAQSALMAEIRAKAAILAGPAGAARWLPQGGVIVLDDATHRVIEPPMSVSLGELSRFIKHQ